MSAKSITVTLKRDGKALVSIDMVRGCEPVLVGRSHSCALHTPPDESSVSGKHARLYWKGSSLYLEDTGSRNGIYFNGSKIVKPIKVEIDGLYGIGNCILVATSAAKANSRGKNACHRLEYLNGSNAHQVVDIRAKPDSADGAFTIGLDPGCDICLPDMLVSRHHAKLTVRSGGDCWIADEGSRNGTYVNGEKLSSKERLLRDGDKISIAYFDFRFLDKGVAHARAYLWTKIGVLAVTLAVIATAWVIYTYGPQPTAEDYRALAAKAAEQERFAEALAYLDSAEMARNASVEKIQNAAARTQIARWKETSEAWEEIKGCLQNGSIVVARNKLVPLMGEAYIWNWNGSSATEKMREASFANELLRLCSDTAIDLKKAESDVGVKDLVAKRLEICEGYMAKNKARIAAVPYLAAVAKKTGELVSRLEKINAGIARIDAALETVSASNPDFSGVVASLSAEAENASLPSVIRNYVKSILPTCMAFVAANDFLEKERAIVTDMDWRAGRKANQEFVLPDKDACARLARLSDARESLQRRHARYQKEMSVLAPMVSELETAGIQNGEKGRIISFVTSMATWNKALRFDCFQGTFPLSSRVAPNNSVYDELLGIEWTIENLRELPKSPRRKTSVIMNFIPKCQTAKIAFEQIGTFMMFMDRPEGQEFKSGKLGRLYAVCAEILADRDKMVSMLRKYGKSSSSDRAKIVAGYYAEFFSDEPSYAELRSLEMAFKGLQKSVAALSERYEATTDPEKRIKLRDEILSVGIPGMEAVRVRWVEAASE